MATHDVDRLLPVAREAAQRAYAPYSGFPVGAALLTASGAIVNGCNVENASYGLTVCAERAAVFNAVAQGHQEFELLLVLTIPSKLLVPCGACLQVLAEFAPDLDVVTGLEPAAVTSLRELLAHPFVLDDDPT